MNFCIKNSDKFVLLKIYKGCFYYSIEFKLYYSIYIVIVCCPKKKNKYYINLITLKISI